MQAIERALIIVLYFITLWLFKEDLKRRLGK